MKIAVIGAGRIGGTIGGAWEKAGHQVVYGLRDPSKKEGAKSLGEALEGADVVLLAIPGSATAQFVHEHAKEVDGKIVIDACNDFGGNTMHQWKSFEDQVPKAHLVRAFNTYGWDVFAQPRIGGEKPDLFYAAPEASRQAVEELIRDVGVEPVWVGGEDAVDVVDGVLRLWFTLSRRLGRHIGFKLVTD